jgi:hypothetical protein
MEKCIRHKISVSFSLQHLLKTFFAMMNELFSESRSRCGTKSHLCLHVNSRLFLSNFSTNSHMSTKFIKLDKIIVEIYLLLLELFILNIKVAAATQSAAFLLTVRNLKTQWR